MLNVKQLTVHVGGSLNRPGKKLLNNINLHLGHGEKLAVLGANGAGKSTLLKCLCGEINGYQGDIILDHLSLKFWNGAERARQMAVMPQKVELAFPFRVDQVVALGRAPHGDENQSTLLQRAAMQCADVWHLRQRNYSGLSGGEQQRVQLARVLAQIWQAEINEQGQELPRYLLLDECTSALDPAHQHSIMQRVGEFAGRGVAVLAVMHDISLAASWADNVLILRHGEVLACGGVGLLADAQLLAAAYALDLSLAQRYAEQNLGWLQSAAHAASG
ncbi:MAG: heme ABC transporter ATP-binding protein [Saccharospirillaceae bacterium]|nr:heme ABC transporter ATP-binding protein [Saccharospirillaceae bacterium]